MPVLPDDQGEKMMPLKVVDLTHPDPRWDIV
jgi:hypothetical protein